MKKLSDSPATDRPKVSVTEHNLLVPHRQSKKLADIRKKLQPDLPVEVAPLKDKQSLTGLKPEVAAELTKARKLIAERIDQIMRSFPEGKKKKLFGFRFGPVDAIPAMTIKAAFTLLVIDDHLVNMKLIGEMNVDKESTP
ncbi:MAG: hypothetical protein ACXWE9_05550 [Methylobacter sp.]